MAHEPPPAEQNLDRIDGVDFIEEMCEFGRAISWVEAAHFAGFV